MLVLSRKNGQKIEINGGSTKPNGVTITVIAITHEGKVRLGFEAAPLVSIHRSEIQEKINEN